MEERKMESLRAKDIMISLDEYPHVPFWYSIKEAVEIMRKSQIEIEGKKSLPRALLVFDEENHLLGIVRRRDLLKGLEPKFLRTMPIPERKKLFDIEADLNLIDLTSGQINQAMREQAKTPVSDIMIPVAATAEYDEHLAKIIYKMVSRDMTLIPILKDREVVGVVRTVDVFDVIAKAIE